MPIASESVQLVLTSPPYLGLRKYAGGSEGDFGREKTIEAYVQHTLEAMREVRRVLRADGICFWNVGDSYLGSGRGLGAMEDSNGNPLRGQDRAKCLCLVPERISIAALTDGWVVRSIIVWEKPNCVPESVRDRPTHSYEHIIMLVKQKKYLWNYEEAQEPSKTPPHPVGSGPKGDAFILDGTHGERTKRLMPPIGNAKHQALGKGTLVGNRVEYKSTRNMRDVWSIPTQPHRDAHIAMWPEALVARCIRIGSRPGDTVLDCFAGSGCTGLVANQLGRNAVLLDTSTEYVALMKQRLEGNEGTLENAFVPRNTGQTSGYGDLVEH